MNNKQKIFSIGTYANSYENLFINCREGVRHLFDKWISLKFSYFIRKMQSVFLIKKKIKKNRIKFVCKEIPLRKKVGQQIEKLHSLI